MPGSESALHRELKRLALAWARQQGYTIAAEEVSVPRLGRCRLDVAAYRPAPAAASREAAGAMALGSTAVFECKQSRGDFLRDTACETALRERLAKLPASAAPRTRAFCASTIPPCAKAASCFRSSMAIASRRSGTSLTKS